MRPLRHSARLLFVPVFALAFIAWGCSKRESGRAELSLQLQALVDCMIDTQSEDPIHNAVLLVESPKIRWKGAAGMADGKIEPMTADHKFKIASIGKAFTATIVLQLMEEGALDLDDTIATFLDDPVVNVDRVHIYQGVAYGRAITVEQLLRHTSGIKDYMENPRFIPDVLADPKAQYNPAKILGKYYEYQSNREAAFPPGAGFNYSDVNYVLLAMIIERVTGHTYQDQLKTRIFDKLGMDNSYLEYYEPPRGRASLSHAYISALDLVTDVNTSFDWGGGGIVSTCAELNLFLRALIDGKLFKERSTLERMLAAADDGAGGTDYTYGLGIMKRSLNGLTYYGHGGAYDCDAFYCPEKGISVCMSLNQMNTHGKRDRLLLEATRLIM